MSKFELSKDKVMGSPCEKCYDGTYSSPTYNSDAMPGYYGEGLIYTCNNCHHRKVTSTRPKGE